MDTKNLKNLGILGLIAVGIVLMLSGSVNAYNINGNICTCNSCDDCEDALNNNSCTIVNLNTDTIDYKGICINNPQNFTNKTFDCQGYKINGSGLGRGIYLDGKSGNTIKNCVITDFGFGIYLYYSSNNILTNNTANNNWYYGILLGSSSNSTLTNNIANKNWDGIYLSSSSNITLINNTANNNSNDGIHISYSSYNTLINNTANNNWKGVYLDSSYNTLTNNTANNNKCHGIYIYSSLYNNLTHNTINNDGYGIYSHNSSHNTLIHNIANNNRWYGIELSSSSNNTIINNTANSNNYTGVYIFDNSNFNKIEGNEILNNEIGIFSNASSSIINNNYVCGNIQSDFYSTDWLSSYGDNNTCDNTDGWNNTNTIGCTNTCKAKDIFDAVEMLEYLNGQRNITQLTHQSKYYKFVRDGDINLYDVFVLMNNIVISRYISISDHKYSLSLKEFNTECIETQLANATLRSAYVLDLPIPKDAKCFYHRNFNLSECAKYHNGPEPACPKFYNPVYDSNGVFYPTACWAEHFGVKNYQHGYSPQFKQFIRDLWFTKKLIRSVLPPDDPSSPPPIEYKDTLYFKVPEPNIEFTYEGSGLSFGNGVFFRSVLWENSTKYYILDFNIDTEDGTQMSTSFGEYNTVMPVYGKTRKSLLVFVMFDKAYPENVLIEWTNKYGPLINDYIKKKQKVPNPIQYDFIPVVIDPPEGVEKRKGGDYTEEELRKIFDAATNKIGKSDFDAFIFSPVVINGSGGYFGPINISSSGNYIEFIFVALAPLAPYSDTDKQKGLDDLVAFHEMMQTISHEILHAVGLPGDHVPMGYGTTYLDFVGQDVDPITGKRRTAPSECDFFGKSSDYYAVDLPDNLTIKVGNEPSWLYKSESSSGPCLSGLYNNAWLKDYDNDGKYEIMYSNNLIGIELQRALGWVDIDSDGVTELVDNDAYGDFKRFIPDEEKGEVIDPLKFTFIKYENIGDCKFAKVKLENNFVGLVPMKCAKYNDDVVNIYKGVNYYWIKIKDNNYGTILLARLPR